MADFHKQTSFYKQTPQRDFYLDIWNPITVPASVNDREYVIESKYEQRPDLLAHDEYGSPRLWWIFALVNKDILIDPIGDFNTGKTITIPTKRTIEGLI
jgi:hypothetical protein